MYIYIIIHVFYIHQFLFIIAHSSYQLKQQPTKLINLQYTTFNFNNPELFHIHHNL